MYIKNCCELFMNDVCLFITEPLFLVQCDITCYSLLANNKCIA